MKLILFFLAAFLIVTTFTFSKCNKDPLPPPLPAETQTGANTLGCKINGEIYRARGLGACYNYLVQYYKSDSALLIKTNNTCATALQISLKSIFELKDYQISNPVFNSFYYSTKVPVSCNLYERTNSIQTGIVTITRFDLPNKIVSGRFNGVLKQTGCPDINITEGRFDFKLDVYN